MRSLRFLRSKSFQQTLQEKSSISRKWFLCWRNVSVETNKGRFSLVPIARVIEQTMKIATHIRTDKRVHQIAVFTPKHLTILELELNGLIWVNDLDDLIRKPGDMQSNGSWITKRSISKMNKKIEIPLQYNLNVPVCYWAILSCIQ